MEKTTNTFDWANLAFASKRPVRGLNATLIAAPREISVARFKQLIKTYLPSGNIVLGIAKESYVVGFEGQPQFRMLDVRVVQKVIDQVNTASKSHHIYTLQYSQPELSYILDKIAFKRVVLVRGSWKQVFHSLPAYYALASKRVPFEYVSPFADEQEARDYEARVVKEWGDQLEPKTGDVLSEQDMLEAAAHIAQQSYDYSYQTGVVVGKRVRGGSYRYVVGGFNKVVPYQTYAMLNGAAREDNLSPANDLNHYDTIHAEVCTVLRAQQGKISLAGTTLFINLMPCPSCARMFAETDIEEFVYSMDHSDGYAVKLLTAAGKTVRRLVL